MPRVRITPQAERDLATIWSYLAERSVAAAGRFVERVLQKAELLAEHPGVGAPRDELAIGIRSYALGKYVLYYQQIDAGIELIRVLHGARKLPDAFHRG